MVMIKVNRVFTSFGEVLTTEPDSNPDKCWSGDEVDRVQVEVPLDEAFCSICGKRIEG